MYQLISHYLKTNQASILSSLLLNLNDDTIICLFIDLARAGPKNQPRQQTVRNVFHIHKPMFKVKY